MARRRKTKTRAKKNLFQLSVLKRKSKSTPTIIHNINLMDALKILAIAIVLVAAIVGFVFLKGYVTTSPKTAILELTDTPYWVSDTLKEKIYIAAGVYSRKINIDEDTAKIVQQNILSQIVWLDDVTVQTTHNKILIKGFWRKPIASVKSGKRSCYLDAEMVVLDYLPMPKLAIVNIEGLPSKIQMPPPGQLWQSDDISAAIEVLNRLKRMDNLITPDKPLLNEISRIDISNFNGRKSSSKPHILLYTTDNTKIIWGAEIGTWQRHLEAPDEEKLTNLYAYYKENGTLLGGAKYINLQYSQKKVSLPIDKY